MRPAITFLNIQLSNSRQVWRFTHEEVLAVQEYIDANGLFGSQEGFLATFGHCRVQ